MTLDVFPSHRREFMM